MRSALSRAMSATAAAALLSAAAAAAQPTTLQEAEAGDAATVSGERISAIDRYAPQLYVEGKLGTDRSIGTADLFLPLLAPENGLLFGDFRFRFDDDQSLEYNLGGGYRHQVHPDWIVGVYGFFDILRSEFDNTFLQGTIGVELMSENLRLRGNGYIPESDDEPIGDALPMVELTGNQILTFDLQAMEQALPGFDLEAGYRLPLFHQDLWLYAGGFYFDRDDVDQLAGPRLRAEYLVDTSKLLAGSTLVLGGQWQWDQVRDSQAFVSIGWRVPLGGVGPRVPAAVQAEAQRWRYTAMTARIERDIDVVTGDPQVARVGEQPATNPLTGRAFGRVVYVKAGASGSGTQEDPAGFDAAVRLAGADGVIFVDGSAGPVHATGVELPRGITILGGGAEVGVVDHQGRLRTLAAPGARPQLVVQGVFSSPLTNTEAQVTFQGLDVNDSASRDSGITTGPQMGEFDMFFGHEAYYVPVRPIKLWSEDVRRRDPTSSGSYVQNSSTALIMAKYKPDFSSIFGDYDYETSSGDWLVRLNGSSSSLVLESAVDPDDDQISDQDEPADP